MHIFSTNCCLLLANKRQTNILLLYSGNSLLYRVPLHFYYNITMPKLPSLLLITVFAQHLLFCGAVKLKGNEIAIASHRHHFDKSVHQEALEYGNAAKFRFRRFQSPSAIKGALSACRNSPLKWFQGKDGRKGYVSSTKLGGDWVLAESEQTAPECTSEEVLRAYLTGELQERWNEKEVLECKINVKKGKRGPRHETHYQQDLVLKSQRVITSHTGIMRYSQTISIDKIGENDYTVLVRLDPEQQTSATSTKKPFESLSVYVGLKQKGDDVQISAAGIMEVNRKVIPNLLVFDASGIAGAMAGKGTLWLASYFNERREMVARASTLSS